MAECDIDDIICNFKALTSMRELKAALGNESFIQEFPELENVAPKLEAKIISTRTSLKEALTKCGNIDLDEVPEIPEVEEEGNKTEEE